MNCPKCGGEAYLSDEEFAHAAEKVTPPKLIVKATFVCNKCYDKFTRVLVHNLEAKTDSMTGTGTVNRILGELNFPEQSTKVDTSVLESLSSLDTPESTEKSEKARFTEL